jgi:hypothetical protein
MREMIDQTKFSRHLFRDKRVEPANERAAMRMGCFHDGSIKAAQAYTSFFFLHQGYVGRPVAAPQLSFHFRVIVPDRVQSWRKYSCSKATSFMAVSATTAIR